MPGFEFEDRPMTPRPSKRGTSPVVIIGGLLGLGVIGIAGLWLMSSKPVKLALERIENQTVEEGSTVKVALKATAEGLKPGEWAYGLVSGPAGSKVDPRSGTFTWTPDEDQGPEEHSVTVGVQGKKGRGQDTQKFKISVKEVNQPPVISEIPVQTVAAGEAVRVTVKASDADIPAQRLTYKLKTSPADARIDGTTGVITWTAPDSGTTSDVGFEVTVSDAESGGAEASMQFKVQVEPPASPVMRLVAALQKSGLTVETTVGVAPPGFTGVASHFGIDDDLLTFLEYDSADSASEDAAQVTDGGQTLFGEPARWKSKTHLYRKDKLIAVYGGESPVVVKAIQGLFGEPFVVAAISKVMPAPEKPIEKTIDEKLIEALAKLHEQHNLTGKKDYLGVRKVYADFIEKQNELLLTRLGEGDGAEFKKWFDDHPDFKEEFLIAVAPEDDMAEAWKILQKLHERFPTKLNDYNQLAIALALTWDNEGNIDHYTDHQQRTHSKMPSGLLGAIENFEYYVDAAAVMQGRAQFLPWEFLVYLVNHKTPRNEREWAATNYVSKRPMFGKCYADVPYDDEMLRTESRICKLAGKDYTLPNIRQFGGVCAMQADFAARVGKSIGVPAEYVGGESNGGELHAWVMWVEVKQATRTSIAFTLESHGRYRGDKYYVGTLREPQTGRETTDRALELRLQGVGLNTAAFRHAALVMKAFPQLRDKLELTPVQEIAFLNEVIDLCPGNEAAWTQLATLARDGKIGADSNRQMTAMIDKFFRTFANFPDFTLKVFDDLVQYQKSSKLRNKYYLQLVLMYEAAGRADLACEARLQLCGYLLEEGNTKDVIDGLAVTIKKFPDEGRYVPKLLDKLEQVCAQIKGADQQLLRFYQEFLPMVPQKRGDAPSPYCMRMLERAIEKFTAAGQVQQAQVYAVQLAKLKASE
ncbi:MAG: putative Ig domain-containing protein [Planctomycetaceae bacterium]